MKHPFVRKRPNPKRIEPRRTGDRVILRGPAKTQRRREIFERSGGRCEAMLVNWGGSSLPGRCNRPITWETMQWSHPDHGPYKDDRYGIASCAECHEVGVHNPKACPRKPGRTMNQREALAYWHATDCFCDGEKATKTSFCPTCKAKLPPQLQLDVENTTGKDWLTAMALAEQALLTWKEEKVHGA